MRTVEIYNVGKVGVIADQPPHTLPPEAWSSAKNIRFSVSGVQNMAGEAQVFGTLLHEPAHLLCVPTSTVSFWIYLSKLKAAVYEGGVHTNITRQTAMVDVDYTTAEEWQWQSTLFGGIPIINNGLDIPQFWGAASPSTKLANLTAWPSTLRAKQVKTFGRFLVALNLTDGLVELPQTIQWSHSADPGTIPSSWDIADPTLDAGRLDLTDALGGDILDAVLLGNALIIYKANSTHTLRLVGGNDIFAPDLILPTSGIIAPKCACEIDNGKKHFVVTPNDVIVHSGTKDVMSVVEDRVLDQLFSEINSAALNACFSFDNAAKKEAWFAYPEQGFTRPTKAMVYNYSKGTITFRDFSHNTAAYGFISDTISGDWSGDPDAWDTDVTAWSDEGNRGIIVGNTVLDQLLKLERGYQIAGTTPVAEVVRTGLAIIGRDRQGQPKVDYKNNKIVNRIWPKITGSAIVQVQVGVQENFNTEVVWNAVQEFNPQTDNYLDMEPPVEGRLIAVRFASTSEQPWRLEGYDLELEVLGNLG